MERGARHADDPRAARWALLCLAGALACGEPATPPAPAVDAGAGPEPDPIGAPLTVIVEVLSPEVPTAAAPLAGGRAVIQTQAGLRLATTATVTPILGGVGALAGAAEWSGTVVVAGEAGIGVLERGSLVGSPLGDALPGFGARQLLEARPGGRAGLWLAGSGGLAVWSDGQLRSVEPAPLPATGCVMAFGAPVGATPALWLACQGTLYGLVPAGAAFQAHRQVEVSVGASLAADVAGALWIEDGRGAVWSRGRGGGWRPHDFARGVTRVVAASVAEEVWFETMEGLWVYDQAAFRPVSGADGARLLAALGPGRALAASPQGLLRLSVGLRVDLEGLEDGALLSAPVELTVHPLRPDAVLSLTAAVDDVAIPVLEGARIALDPEDFEDGTHTLVVRADYGAEAVQASLRFSRYAGPPPTWRADVQPLFAERCALCHGAQGSARRLDTAPIWAEQIDVILENVRSGRMPLPPNRTLSSDEVARIEGWAAAGFPEGA
jgi:hypothetical protein